MSRTLPADRIKVKVLSQLIFNGALDDYQFAINEFSNLNCGVRADLALVSSEQICAIEIKSERDSLQRLERQISYYERYFDKTIIVVDKRHANAAALACKSTRAGLWIYSSGKIEIRKKGRSKRVQDNIIFDELLPRIDQQRLGRILSPRQALFSSLQRRYKTSVKEIKQMREKGEIEIADVLNLNPHYKQRLTAYRRSELAESEWLKLAMAD